MRRLLVMPMVLLLVAACGGSGATPSASATPTATALPSATAASASGSAPAGSASPVAGNYSNLTSRGWDQLVAAPDKYVGNGYIVWACITRIDGTTLRGQASNREEANWATDGSLAFFTVTDAQLADVAAGDVLTMSVVSTGVHDAGASAGAVAAPGFEVREIARAGSCS
jgi:hypothetical protein